MPLPDTLLYQTTCHLPDTLLYQTTCHLPRPTSVPNHVPFTRHTCVPNQVSFTRHISVPNHVPFTWHASVPNHVSFTTHTCVPNQVSLTKHILNKLHEIYNKQQRTKPRAIYQTHFCIKLHVFNQTLLQTTFNLPNTRAQQINCIKIRDFSAIAVHKQTDFFNYYAYIANLYHVPQDTAQLKKGFWFMCRQQISQISITSNASSEPVWCKM